MNRMCLKSLDGFRSDWEKGKLAQVRHKQWAGYTEAVHDYVLELIFRSADKFGFDARAQVASQLETRARSRASESESAS